MVDTKMKPILLLCIVVISINDIWAIRQFYRGHLVGYDIPPPSDDGIYARTISTNEFQQKLDHYDPTNKITWSQRYYVNDEYFNDTERNVAFLMISGEGEASIGWTSSGAWIETAKKQQALVFQVEHRFYGASHPFSDLSTENLRYLSSLQALGDLATFISAMNDQYQLSPSVKWIAFGGSYAGSLAAWLRQKYPHLVQGAMSASGPLFAKIDFPEYLQVVADDLATYSQECVDVVKTAVNQLDDMLNSGENVTELFNLCDDISQDVNNTSDIANFFELIADNFAGVAQYNKNSGRQTSIDTLCDILTNETVGSEVSRLAEVNKLVSGSDCLDYKYQNTVDMLKNTTITNSGNMRQWIYQTCTEYGWYQTSSQENQVFGDKFPLDFFTQLCVDVYGPEFNETYIIERNNHINVNFGGYDIDTSNVVFVQGSFDPWYPMGLTNTTKTSAPVIFINGTAHCANMYNITDADIPELITAREEVDRLIDVWLNPLTTSSANIRLSDPVLYVTLMIVLNFLSVYFKC